MTGLEALYNHQNATVDIVFIHGLHGDIRKTWKHGSVVWPQDLLPDNIPEVSIMTFGYDANIAHFWARLSESTIDTFSDDLFQQLQNERSKTNTSERPIIFVAHSLGKIVCANALVDAASSSPYSKNLANCVRYIAFLGTPHNGSDKGRWASTGATLLSYFKETNEELSKSFGERTEKLVKLGKQFPQHLISRAKEGEAMLDVVCFYEGRVTHKGGVNLGMIVSSTSSCIPGYPQVLLEADHENMCKFEGKNDINYKRVSGQLAAWVKELQKPKEESKKQHAYQISFDRSTNNGGFQIGLNNGNISIGSFPFGRA